MKNVGLIVKGDFKRVGRSLIALIVIIGISVIPALYAWFNIAANWDPYSSTSGIKVAVVNDDKGVTVDGVNFEVGKQIVSSLKENDAIGWQFVDKKTAMEGVKAGDYYAAIIVPNKFSSKISSFLKDKVESPDIEYYVNEKKNAIAPKITDKGISTIQEKVNSTFISTAVETIAKVFNVASEDLESNGVPIIDKIVNTLTGVESDLKAYESTIDAFINSVDSINSLTKTTKYTLPDVNNVLKATDKTINNASDTLDKTTATVGDITKGLGNVLDDTGNMYNDFSTTASSAFNTIESDTIDAAGTMTSSATDVNGLISRNQEVITELEKIQSTLPKPLTSINDLVTKLKKTNTNLEKIASTLTKTAGNVTNTANVSQKTRKELNSQIKKTSKKITNIRSTYRSQVEPDLNNTINGISKTNSSISGVLASTQSSIGNIGKIFDGINDSLKSGKSALKNTKKVIKTTTDKIDKLITEVNGVSKDKKVQKFLEILKSDPEIMGNFMSSPVNVKTTSLYEVKNYGSAMSPFYTILAIWVGGIVLVAILKVGVKPEKYLANLKPWEAYVGRFVIFMAVGILQSIIICLGDLFFLKIQCDSPGLFVLAGVIASIIFNLIIYTLTVSFGDIGKAICVVIMVVQVAGSGGTFPIEVLPEFFQKLNPFFPFTYGINAMRETIGGMYGNYYWMDILALLMYIPFALLLGLVLRKPLIRLNEFFNNRLKDTRLM